MIWTIAIIYLATSVFSAFVMYTEEFVPGIPTLDSFQEILFICLIPVINVPVFFLALWALGVRTIVSRGRCFFKHSDSKLYFQNRDYCVTCQFDKLIAHSDTEMLKYILERIEITTQKKMYVLKQVIRRDTAKMMRRKAKI